MLLMNDLKELAAGLFDAGAIQFGRFVSPSGDMTPMRIDLRMVISNPTILKRVANVFAEKLTELDFDLLAAIPYGGLPIGVAVSLAIDMPLIYPRKSTDSYGSGRSIEGRYEVGQRVVIIEDLVSTGESALAAIASLRASGLEVCDVVVLVNQLQGASDVIVQHGCKLHAVLDLEQLVHALEATGRINSAQRLAVTAAMY